MVSAVAVPLVVVSEVRFNADSLSLALVDSVLFPIAVFLDQILYLYTKSAKSWIKDSFKSSAIREKYQAVFEYSSLKKWYSYSEKIPMMAIHLNPRNLIHPIHLIRPLSCFQCIQYFLYRKDPEMKSNFVSILICKG